MIKRADALQAILQQLPSDALALFATGVISREAQASADRLGNLYLMGAMGLVSSIGAGIAITQPNRLVAVVEGDGGMLMELASLNLIAHLSPRNYLQVILDNEAYESTGGQPTLSRNWSLSEMARQAGYAHVSRAVTAIELASCVKDFVDQPQGPAFIQAKTEARPDAAFPPRIRLAPDKLTERFRKALQS